MVVLLKDQIDEWFRSELVPRAIEWARKNNREDALQDKLTEFLEEDGKKPSRYKDIKELHEVLLKAVTNCHKDILRRDSRRRLVWEKGGGRWREASTMRSDLPVEEQQGQEAAQEADDVLRSVILNLEPLDRIIILIDRKITGRDVMLNMRSNRTTIAFDPDMISLVQDAAARLEPPVSADEVGTWTTLEDVARNLHQPPGTLRSRKSRAYVKLQRSLEDRGVSFEQWNNF